MRNAHVKHARRGSYVWRAGALFGRCAASGALQGRGVAYKHRMSAIEKLLERGALGGREPDSPAAPLADRLLNFVDVDVAGVVPAHRLGEDVRSGHDRQATDQS
jgi:hypothetical protein